MICYSLICWYSVGPPFATLAQHQTSTGTTYRWLVTDALHLVLQTRYINPMLDQNRSNVVDNIGPTLGRCIVCAGVIWPDVYWSIQWIHTNNNKGANTHWKHRELVLCGIQAFRSNLSATAEDYCYFNVDFARVWRSIMESFPKFS